MRLISAAQSIEVETSAGVSANDLHFVATYTDKNKDAVVQGCLTGVFTNSNITCVPAPANNTSRDVEELSFYNADTMSATVIVTFVDVAGNRILKKSTLTTGQTLLFEVFSGWAVN